MKPNLHWIVPPRRVVVGALLLLLENGPTLADTGTAYRWTDASGVVHFEQTPPSDRPYQVVHPMTMQLSGPPTDDGSSAFLKQAGDDDARLAKERADAANDKVTAAAQCSQARTRLQFLDEHPPNRLLVRDASGETKRMDADQWETERKTASDVVSSSCVN